MTDSRTYLGAWRSAEAEARFRAGEEELAIEELGALPDSVTVPTHLGPTHVWRWNVDGPGEPVVFLHGASGTGSTWAPWAKRVEAAGHPVFAPDTVGDVGRTRQDVAVSSVDDLVRWLDETLEGAGATSAHLVGTSYGGFLALALAAHRPARVRSLFLIEPASVVKLHMIRFLLWGGGAMLASRLPLRLRRIAARRLRMPWIEDGRLLSLGFYAQRNHKPGLLPVPLFTDEEFASIAGVPARVLLGAKSEPFRTPDAIARLRSAWPSAAVEVFPDAGHALQVSEEETLVEELLAFLDPANVS